MTLSKLKSLNGPLLVTGHTGFKGTWLMLLLEILNIEAVGVSLPPEKNSLYTRANITGRVPEFFLDLRDTNAVERIFNEVAPSAVIHLAAESLVLEAYRNPYESFSTNVGGTINLLNSARNTGSVQAVGAVTTDKIYENTGLKRRFSEQDRIAGNEPYSSSKAAMEMVVLGWQQLFHQFGGMYPFSLRAGNVIGGGDFSTNRLLPDIVRAIDSRKTLEVRNPTSVRPWQHVLDPLYGYLLALEWTLNGNTTSAFNFGPNGDDLEVREVIEIAKRTWSENFEELKVRYVEPEFHESKHLSLDSSLAKDKLGWKSRYSQIEAVESTINWWSMNMAMASPAIELCKDEIENYLRNL